MPRFTKNRQTALILALAAALLAGSLLRGTAFASPIGGKPDPEAPGPGDGKGDPDDPTGPTRQNFVGRQQIVSQQPRDISGRTFGVPRSGWMWRLRIVMQGYRYYWFRF